MPLEIHELFPDQDEDPRTTWVRDTIATHGHAVMGVGAGECDFCPPDQEPKKLELPFYYTVGLYEAKFPELILFGLSPIPAASLLNDMAHRMRKQNKPFEHMEYVDLGGRYALLVVNADKPETCSEYVLWHHRLYGIPRCDVMQLIAADKNGFLPPYGQPPYSVVPVLTTSEIPVHQEPIR